MKILKEKQFRQRRGGLSRTANDNRSNPGEDYDTFENQRFQVRSMKEFRERSRKKRLSYMEGHETQLHSPHERDETVIHKMTDGYGAGLA